MQIATDIKVGQIVTFSGVKINPFELELDQIRAIDIAHALSNVCRYGGHVDKTLSVAQHSCLVHDYAPAHLKKPALMHDSPEYLIGDMVAPLKHLPIFEFFRELEDEIYAKIAERFDLPYVLDPVIKEIDVNIRGAEIRDLKKAYKRDSSDCHYPKIESWSPTKSKYEMLMRMEDLGIPLGYD